MGIFHALVDGTSVLKFSVFCATMIFVFGGLAWLGHRDTRSELGDQR